MKKIITIYILLTCGIGYGQNLVPNGDFEQFSGCPTNWGQIDSALFWMNPTIVGAGGGSSSSSVQPIVAPVFPLPLEQQQNNPSNGRF